MSKSVNSAVFAAVVWSGLAGAASAATLQGNVIDAQYRFPDISTPYGAATTSPNPFTVGAGIEATIDVESVTFLDIDFSDTSLLITLRTILGAPTWNNASHNGPVFTVVSGNAFPAITSVTVSDLGPVAASLLSGVLSINWAGWSYNDGDTVEITFASPSVVPIPAALPLFAAGLGGLAAVGKYRKRKTAQV